VNILVLEVATCERSDAIMHELMCLPGVAEQPRVAPYGPSGLPVPPPQPPQGLDAYLRMPGAYFSPTIWEA